MKSFPAILILLLFPAVLWSQEFPGTAQDSLALLQDTISTVQDSVQAVLETGEPAELSDTTRKFVKTWIMAEDYTVIDLYIEDPETGHLHNLHASAQLFERELIDKEWSEAEFWNQQDWSAFWVPYAGDEETENGRRTRFLKGSHREVQVLRGKFAGEAWRMMISVSAVMHEGSYGEEFVFPENAINTDPGSWAKFSFPD